MLQQQKTRLMSRTEFSVYASQMIADNPMDIQKTEILEVINKYSDSPPMSRLPTPR